MRVHRTSLFVILLTILACNAKVKTTDNCGDGFLDPGEACDGSALTVQDCSDLGYYSQSAPLTCRADCTIDDTVCTDRCGDTTIQTNFGEQCDGNNLDGKTCELLGLRGGTLACDQYCRFDSSGCEEQAVCGDGQVQAPLEACDGTDLQDNTCEGLGYYGGTLACDDDCRFDETACATFGRCGDGDLQRMYGEQCEGADLDGQTCEDLGYYGGILLCDTACRFDESNCAAVGRCGDEIIQENHAETCDGTNLGGDTCESLGYHGGELSCNAGCTLDLADCEAHGACGDGFIQMTEFEECETGNLMGHTCLTLGYHGGELLCDAECRLDVSLCEAAGRCGDGAIQASFAEQCDGASLGGATCLTLGYYGGQLACGPACTLDVTNCATYGRCGDGVIQSARGEGCDGADLNDFTCESFGMTGTLVCSASCILDTSGCH